MALPRFYFNGALSPQQELWLDDDTVRHVVQVLRMQAGEQLELTNGSGTIATTIITDAQKKKCKVRVAAVTITERKNAALHLAIGFTKNASRNEWLLEKVTELGVQSIIPLATARTEREKTRLDRWNNILVSAMLQSQQAYLPQLHESTALPKVLEQFKATPQKLIGHCNAQIERRPLHELLKPRQETIILIGPEGDFTEDEVHLSAAQYGYAGISMGSQRLRTETAAMAACAYFNLVNDA